MGLSAWWKEMGNRKQRAEQLARDTKEAARRAVEEVIARERARRQAILKACSSMRPAGERWNRGKGIGQIVVAAVGTAAANELPDFLREHQRAGTGGHIGPILLAEPSEESRDICLKSIPEEFLDRVVTVTLPLLPGGFLGRTVSEAMAIKEHWEEDVKAAIRQWLTRVRSEATVVCLVLLVSPGGSGVLGWYAAQAFKAEYDQSPAYVVMVLDHKGDRREENIPELLDLYGQGDVVKGIIFGDNRWDARLFDQAIALLFASMIAAPWIDPRPQAGLNVLPDIFRKQRVATIRIWAGWLPVEYFEPFYTLPEVWYTKGTFFEIQALRGIKEVIKNPTLQALALPQAERPQFIYVASAMRPDPDLKELAERTRARLARSLSPEISVSFPSIGHPLNPDTKQAPIVVISVFPVLGGLKAVRKLALGQSVPVIASTKAVISGNGSTPTAVPEAIE